MSGEAIKSNGQTLTPPRQGNRAPEDARSASEFLNRVHEEIRERESQEEAERNAKTPFWDRVISLIAAS